MLVIEGEELKKLMDEAIKIGGVFTFIYFVSYFIHPVLHLLLGSVFVFFTCSILIFLYYYSKI